MKIQLKQVRHHGEIIEGQIFIEGQFICDTLQNETNTLPKGKYIIRVQKCKFHGRKMPLIISLPDEPSPSLECDQCHQIEDVSNNTSMPHFCPMISAGNGIHNRHDGCILVGKRGARGLLLHTMKTFNSLYDRIRKSSQRGNEITITIQ